MGDRGHRFRPKCPETGDKAHACHDGSHLAPPLRAPCAHAPPQGVALALAWQQEACTRPPFFGLARRSRQRMGRFSTRSSHRAVILYIRTSFDECARSAALPSSARLMFPPPLSFTCRSWFPRFTFQADQRCRRLPRPVSSATCRVETVPMGVDLPLVHRHDCTPRGGGNAGARERSCVS